MAKFNKRLKELREERQLSQEQLAEFLGISTRGYQFYEAGERELNLKNIEKLAGYFDVSADYLLGYTDDPHGSFGDKLRWLTSKAHYDPISNILPTIMKSAKKAAKRGKRSDKTSQVVADIGNRDETAIALRKELEKMKLTVVDIKIDDPQVLGIAQITVEVAWPENE